MRNEKLLSVVKAVSFALIVPFLIASAAWAGTETVLVNFDGTNGNQPLAGLIFDKAGNLYGTSSYAGTFNAGIVFELSPNADGTWSEAVLHDFGSGDDGIFPASELAFDRAGILYGTTGGGGDKRGFCAPDGCGTVFKLTPSNGNWTEEVLYRFKGEKDGYTPIARVALDKHGNIYGTTSAGGTGCSGCGTVFELVRSNGKWSKKVLHAFTGWTKGTKDGFSPNAGVVLDNAGNLYGTTLEGGTGCSSCGIVYEVSPTGRGWKETILHDFNGTDGAFLLSDLVFDKHGNLYGTANGGGAYTYGSVFELKREPHGAWTEKTLYSFTGGTDGSDPFVGVVFGSNGELYGTTYVGGAGNGVVFKLTKVGGQWNEQVLHAFAPNGSDGAGPWAAVVLDEAGSIYGTTSAGGSDQSGVVFEVTP